MQRSGGSWPLPRGSTLLLACAGVSVLIYFLLFFHATTSHTSSSSNGNIVGSGPSRDSNSKDPREIFNDMEGLLQRLEAEHQEVEKFIKLYENRLALRGSGDASKSSLISTDSPSHSSSSSSSSSSSTSTSSNKEGEHIETFHHSTSVIKKPITYSSKTATDSKAVLVIGGTDGSGTRRVVQILAALGAVMVSEDPETHDIHADLIGGWPPIVSRVLKHTRSINYKPSNFPNDLKETVIRGANKLLAQADADSHKPTSYKLAVGGVLPRKAGAECKHVKFGFKAPISMTLVPLWAELLPHFKFIHVLRDGRDIAFSANQGPVTKFYRDMYGNQFMNLNGEEKAVKLWSDWNSQVNEWSKNYAEQLAQSSVDSKSFEYLAIHTEDLVSPSITVRFAAIKHLAEVAGSTLTDMQLCCIAAEDAEFMGSHDRTERSKDRRASAAMVTSRYGKWKGIIGNNLGLQNSLNNLGGKALEMFGYEPLREISEEGAATESGFVCSYEVLQNSKENSCPAATSPSKSVPKGPFKLPEPSLVSPYAVPNMCEIFENVDFKGGDLDSVALDGTSPQECCRQCNSFTGCKFFTFDTESHVCYVKFSMGTPSEALGKNLVSGKMIN